MESSLETHSGTKQKRKESFEETQKNLRKALDELKNLLKEGKDQHDPMVKDAEDRIRVALDVPKESWAHGQTLKDLIENIYSNLNDLESSSFSVENISDEDVLKSTSGGLCLQGVYKSGNLEDLLERRQQLIEIPESFLFSGPEQSVEFEQKEFSCHKSESDFQKAVERLGFSFTNALKIGFRGFSLENTSEVNRSKEEEKSNVQSCDQSQIYCIKYNYVPLASSFFNKEKLKLFHGAIEELKSIETILLNSNDQEVLIHRVVNFFKRFGSHVNQGPIHFGGVFWWRASAEGFKTAELSEVKSLTSDALNVYVGAAYSGPSLNISAGVTTTSTQLKGALQRNHNEALMSQVCLSIQKTGGPANIDDHFQWKSHLVTGNKTWSVIDRGTTFVPVWEIIMAAHSDVFKDAYSLATCLRKIFSDVTNESVEQMWGENILSAVENARKMIQTVKDWTTSEGDTHLMELVDLKTKLKNEMGSDKTWVETCLSSPILQNFLLDIVTKNKNEQAIYLRFLMRVLLEPHNSVKNFSDKSEIMKWANQPEENVSAHIPVSNIPELIKILKQNKGELEGQCAFSSSEHRSSTEKATCNVTNSLNSLCQTLSDQQEHEAELLVLSSIDALGYSCENKTFNHLLDWKEINFLENEIEKFYKEYCSLKEQSVSKAQAYLCLKALTLSKDEENMSSEKKAARLELIKSRLKDNISNAIKLLVDKSHGNWKLLEEELNSFIKESNFKEENTSGEDTASQLGSLPANRVSLSEATTDFTNISASETAMNNSTNLLKKLGLSDLFPKKIKLNDILVIDHLSMHLNQPDTVEDLKGQYLYKLMILDYNVRYLSLKPVATDAPLEDDGTTSDDFDLFDTNEEPTREADLADTESHIHPMDIHMAVFHCANDFLRQHLYTKLSACQFALPFLVPNPYTEDLEFPLWPLRHIKKSWRSMRNSRADNPGKYQTRQMFSTLVPVVSFLRLGSSFTSKSQILNSVISKQRHSVFFNRHCKGSGPNSMLMDGVVEIAWYCPGGKKDDIFDDCVAFLNLHGDAKDHQLQLQFLQAVSTVNVLLLSEQPLDEERKTICQNLSNSPVPLICLFSGSERVPGSKNPIKVRLAAKNRNEAELTEELITNIKRCIGKYNKRQSIENCSNEARKLKFKVDEDKESFKDGHALAQTLVCLLEDKRISDIKKEFLPLQGELWHNWCLKNKQQFRLSCKTNESIEQQQSVIVSDMKATRQKQREIASSLSDFMRSFLGCLTSSDHSEDTKFYMLQWLRVLLDELSSDHLAKLEENYHSAWSQMRNVPKTKGKAEELDTLRKQLNSISEKMAASTIGLQHIMREVGQMYECSVRQSVGDLPALGAEMLISGYPLELMDGDESHVPLIWIQAVLKSLIDKLGDKKVYVLSILGLQSSGKSTLLNTMFGLQFTVSAGRCTRGAFMQMLKVDEKIREEFGFDLLLVVDTEGLRSPELSTKTSLNHDNELATFIIGIGDMTVINIMGETVSEVHEILQICVQAFLRMKRVEIKPSCIFVHQNVAEESAGDKNMEGRRRLQEKLDEMAQTAAKEEGIDDVYSFSDVIQFDLESQVFYFKNLLEGDPPMAPPNPSYSQNVQDLKTKLLSVAKWQTGFRFPSLSQFRLRVHDLWNALLQESFVFSFRNTLEMMVYSSLEEKYAQWSWKLRKYSLETQTKLENQIGSNNISDVNTTDLISDFDDVYTGLKKEIETHFKDDKHAEILIKWKGNVENRLETLKKELIEKTLKQCKILIENKRSMTELDQKKSHYEKDLMQKSKTMATSLKDKRLSDKEVEKEFSSLWVEWVTEIAKDQQPNEPVNIKAEVEAILCSRFQKQADIMNKIKPEYGAFKFTKSKHISQSWIKGWFKEKRGKGIPQELAEKLHRNVNHMVDEYIRKKELEKTDFNQNFIFEILDNVESHIQEYEHNEDVKFTYEYRVDLSVLVCLSSVQRFQKMHESFKKANNPINYLQSKRDQYLQMFQNYCKGANSVRIFAEFLFKNILPAVEEAIYNQIKLQIIDIMKCNNPAFSGNRCNLENHILRHLADQEEFQSYKEYIDKPKWYFERFIGEHVETFCEDHKRLQDMLHGNLEEMKFRILRISTEVCEEVNLKNGNASMWLDLFCKKLGDHMVINRESLTSIQDEDISDTKFLKDMMTKYLQEVVRSENMESVDATSSHLFNLKQKIKDILFKQLEGCWAQCPFCMAICTNTICNHSGDHSVLFHRSSALGHWYYRETDEFAIDFCTTNVSSDGSFRVPPDEKRIPFKSYRDGGDPYDKWCITADGSTQGYWKWFICRFQKEWEGTCGYKFKGRGAIPDSWRKITKESVLEELNIRD